MAFGRNNNKIKIRKRNRPITVTNDECGDCQCSCGSAGYCYEEFTPTNSDCTDASLGYQISTDSCASLCSDYCSILYLGLCDDGGPGCRMNYCQCSSGNSCGGPWECPGNDQAEGFHDSNGVFNLGLQGCQSLNCQGCYDGLLGCDFPSDFYAYSCQDCAADCSLFPKPNYSDCCRNSEGTCTGTQGCSSGWEGCWGCWDQQECGSFYGCHNWGTSNCGYETRWCPDY